jgi:hypothetical protein
MLNPHVVRTHLRLLQQTGELAPYRRDQVRRQLLSFLVPEDCGPDRESEEVRRWPADPLEIESQLFESFPGTEDEVDRLLERLPGVRCVVHEQCDAANPSLCTHQVDEIVSGPAHHTELDLVA